MPQQTTVTGKENKHNPDDLLHDKGKITVYEAYIHRKVVRQIKNNMIENHPDDRNPADSIQ